MKIQRAGLPVLLLLTFLVSCRQEETTLIYKPGTPDPTLQPDLTETPHQTNGDGQLTQSPTDEIPTPEGIGPICAERAGQIQEYQIPWQDETLFGRIYTPPCYGENDRVYPTLYLLHGATESEIQWDELGVDEMADELISSGEIPPLIIVLPREITWVNPSENPFGSQLVQTLIPWVDSQFRTYGEREYRAVGGVSRGGNWAIRLGLLHWGLFGSLGGHSAPLFFGDLNRIPGWLEDIPTEALPRIYLDVAEADKNLAEAESLREILEDAGASPQWHLYPGLHNEAYWSSHLEEYLLWYSEGWSD